MCVQDRSRSEHQELIIGLVNNMPAKAALVTERQFESLLNAASRKGNAKVRFVPLPPCPLPTSDREFRYNEIVHGSRLDGMIVTGAEPRSADIVDEPIWPALARLADWAHHNTISTIWSCLAAHAAAYYLDGLARKRLPEKLSGVFECEKASGHDLMWDAPPRWHVPHSRYNDLNEESLLRSGYRVLSRIRNVGADIAVKQSGSLFVLMQGHPEYGADSLGREYCRDIKRFLVGERDTYPEMPKHYFDEGTVAALRVLQERALQTGDPKLLKHLSKIVPTLPVPSWAGYAVGFYARWLSYLAQRKSAN
jgi:homoserine O-succinyltransferase/O-acetyltransferase